MPNHFSTRELADLLGSRTWRVRRLYEDGTLPEPDRFVGKRIIPRESIPEIVDALRSRGWLPESQTRKSGGTLALSHDTDGGKQS